MCLHVACRAGQPAQAELLVAWGADPMAKDSVANTPIECARFVSDFYYTATFFYNNILSKYW